jgi:hypothetical protein
MGIQVLKDIKNRALRLIAETVIVKSHVSEQEAERRMSVCGGCDRRDAEENKCMECGCFLDLKTAAATNWNARRNRNEITHCPLGRWGDKDTANVYREIDGKELLN